MTCPILWICSDILMSTRYMYHAGIWWEKIYDFKEGGGTYMRGIKLLGGGGMPPKGRKKGTAMLLLPFMKCTYECRKNNTQPAAAQGEQLTFLSKQRWCTEMVFKKDELSSTQCKKIRRMAHLVQPTLHFAATYILHMMHILVLCTIVA